jgi:hypothetical protein
MPIEGNYWSGHSDRSRIGSETSTACGFWSFSMTVPIRFKFWGVEVDTQISLDTANKIACGLACTVAGTAVMAAGAALGNSEVVKAGGAFALASAVGTAAVVGLCKDPNVAHAMATR